LTVITHFLHRSSLFQEDTEDFNPVATILELVQYINNMCVLGQQIENSHNLLIHSNLTFVELVSKLWRSNKGSHEG